MIIDQKMDDGVVVAGGKSRLHEMFVFLSDEF